MTEAEGILLNSFYDASTFLISKPDKDSIRKENRLMSLIKVEVKYSTNY
jgi:hypothetical protein